MAITNVAQFTAGIQQFVDSAESRRRELTKAVTFQVLKNILATTPVDTGRARGNWQLTELTPASGTVERADMDGSEGNFRTLASLSRELDGMNGADKIWFHNGLSYVEYLEDEHKMVEGAVAAARTWMESWR